MERCCDDCGQWLGMQGDGMGEQCSPEPWVRIQPSRISTLQARRTTDAQLARLSIDLSSADSVGFRGRDEAKFWSLTDVRKQGATDHIPGG